jgi:5-oxoprolinase (ATP-hydrolysing)
VRWKIMANLFMAIAEEMGVALQNTASSVNIKERLDFSCAVCSTGRERLIANAPHIRCISDRWATASDDFDGRGDARDGRGMKAGDAYVLNAPYAAARTCRTSR